MELIIKTASVVTMSLVFSMPMIASVKASSIDGAVNSIINTVVTKASNSDDFTQKFCRKGVAASGVFSVRSANGIACKNQYIAAMAELICTPGNLDDYAKSHCHTNAQTALKGRAALDVLRSDLQAKVGQVKTLLCSKKDSLPNQLKVLASKCPTS